MHARTAAHICPRVPVNAVRILTHGAGTYASVASASYAVSAATPAVSRAVPVAIRRPSAATAAPLQPTVELLGRMDTGDKHAATTPIPCALCDAIGGTGCKEPDCPAFTAIRRGPALGPPASTSVVAAESGLAAASTVRAAAVVSSPHPGAGTVPGGGSTTADQIRVPCSASSMPAVSPLPAVATRSSPSAGDARHFSPGEKGPCAAGVQRARASASVTSVVAPAVAVCAPAAPAAPTSPVAAAAPVEQCVAAELRPLSYSPSRPTIESRISVLTRRFAGPISRAYGRIRSSVLAVTSRAQHDGPLSSGSASGKPLSRGGDSSSSNTSRFSSGISLPAMPPAAATVDAEAVPHPLKQTRRSTECDTATQFRATPSSTSVTRLEGTAVAGARAPALQQLDHGRVHQQQQRLSAHDHIASGTAGAAARGTHPATTRPLSSQFTAAARDARATLLHGITAASRAISGAAVAAANVAARACARLVALGGACVMATTLLPRRVHDVVVAACPPCPPCVPPWPPRPSPGLSRSKLHVLHNCQLNEYWRARDAYRASPWYRISSAMGSARTTLQHWLGGAVRVCTGLVTLPSTHRRSHRTNCSAPACSAGANCRGRPTPPRLGRLGKRHRHVFIRHRRDRTLCFCSGSCLREYLVSVGIRPRLPAAVHGDEPRPQDAPTALLGDFLSTQWRHCTMRLRTLCATAHRTTAVWASAAWRASVRPRGGDSKGGNSNRGGASSGSKRDAPSSSAPGRDDPDAKRMRGGAAAGDGAGAPPPPPPPPPAPPSHAGSAQRPCSCPCDSCMRGECPAPNDPQPAGHSSDCPRWRAVSQPQRAFGGEASSDDAMSVASSNSAAEPRRLYPIHVRFVSKDATGRNALSAGVFQRVDVELLPHPRASVAEEDTVQHVIQCIADEHTVPVDGQWLDATARAEWLSPSRPDQILRCVDVVWAHSGDAFALRRRRVFPAGEAALLSDAAHGIPRAAFLELSTEPVASPAAAHAHQRSCDFYVAPAPHAADAAVAVASMQGVPHGVRSTVSRVETSTRAAAFKATGAPALGDPNSALGAYLVEACNALVRGSSGYGGGNAQPHVSPSDAPHTLAHAPSATTPAAAARARAPLAALAATLPDPACTCNDMKAGTGGYDGSPASFGGVLFKHRDAGVRAWAPVLILEVLRTLVSSTTATDRPEALSTGHGIHAAAVRLLTDTAAAFAASVQPGDARGSVSSAPQAVPAIPGLARACFTVEASFRGAYPRADCAAVARMSAAAWASALPPCIHPRVLAQFQHLVDIMPSDAKLLIFLTAKAEAPSAAESHQWRVLSAMRAQVTAQARAPVNARQADADAAVAAYGADVRRMLLRRQGKEALRAKLMELSGAQRAHYDAFVQAALHARSDERAAAFLQWRQACGGALAEAAKSLRKARTHLCSAIGYFCRPTGAVYPRPPPDPTPLHNLIARFVEAYEAHQRAGIRYAEASACHRAACEGTRYARAQLHGRVASLHLSAGHADAVLADVYEAEVVAAAAAPAVELVPDALQERLHALVGTSNETRAAGAARHHPFVLCSIVPAAPERLAARHTYDAWRQSCADTAGVLPDYRSRPPPCDTSHVADGRCVCPSDTHRAHALRALAAAQPSHTNAKRQGKRARRDSQPQTLTAFHSEGDVVAANAALPYRCPAWRASASATITVPIARGASGVRILLRQPEGVFVPATLRPVPPCASYAYVYPETGSASSASSSAAAARTVTVPAGDDDAALATAATASRVTAGPATPTLAAAAGVTPTLAAAAGVTPTLAAAATASSNVATRATAAVTATAEAAPPSRHRHHPLFAAFRSMLVQRLMHGSPAERPVWREKSVREPEPPAVAPAAGASPPPMHSDRALDRLAELLTRAVLSGAAVLGGSAGVEAMHALRRRRSAAPSGGALPAFDDFDFYVRDVASARRLATLLAERFPASAAVPLYGGGQNDLVIVADFDDYVGWLPRKSHVRGVFGQGALATCNVYLHCEAPAGNSGGVAHTVLKINIVAADPVALAEARPLRLRFAHVVLHLGDIGAAVALDEEGVHVLAEDAHCDTGQRSLLPAPVELLRIATDPDYAESPPSPPHPRTIASVVVLVAALLDDGGGATVFSAPVRSTITSAREAISRVRELGRRDDTITPVLRTAYDAVLRQLPHVPAVAAAAAASDDDATAPPATATLASSPNAPNFDEMARCLVRAHRKASVPPSPWMRPTRREFSQLGDPRRPFLQWVALAWESSGVHDLANAEQGEQLRVMLQAVWPPDAREPHCGDRGNLSSGRSAHVDDGGGEDMCLHHEEHAHIDDGGEDMLMHEPHDAHTALDPDAELTPVKDLPTAAAPRATGKYHADAILCGIAAAFAGPATQLLLLALAQSTPLADTVLPRIIIAPLADRLASSDDRPAIVVSTAVGAAVHSLPGPPQQRGATPLRHDATQFVPSSVTLLSHQQQQKQQPQQQGGAPLALVQQRGATPLRLRHDAVPFVPSLPQPQQQPIHRAINWLSLQKQQQQQQQQQQPQQALQQDRQQSQLPRVLIGLADLDSVYVEAKQKTAGTATTTTKKKKKKKKSGAASMEGRRLAPGGAATAREMLHLLGSTCSPPVFCAATAAATATALSRLGYALLTEAPPPPPAAAHRPLDDLEGEAAQDGRPSLWRDATLLPAPLPPAANHAAAVGRVGVVEHTCVKVPLRPNYAVLVTDALRNLFASVRHAREKGDEVFIQLLALGLHPRAPALYSDELRSLLNSDRELKNTVRQCFVVGGQNVGQPYPLVSLVWSIYFAAEEQRISAIETQLTHIHRKRRDAMCALAKLCPIVAATIANNDQLYDAAGKPNDREFALLAETGKQLLPPRMGVYGGCKDIDIDTMAHIGNSITEASRAYVVAFRRMCCDEELLRTTRTHVRAWCNTARVRDADGEGSWAGLAARGGDAALIVAAITNTTVPHRDHGRPLRWSRAVTEHPTVQTAVLQFINAERGVRGLPAVHTLNRAEGDAHSDDGDAHSDDGAEDDAQTQDGVDDDAAAHEDTGPYNQPTQLCS